MMLCFIFFLLLLLGLLQEMVESHSHGFQFQLRSDVRARRAQTRRALQSKNITSTLFADIDDGLWRSLGYGWVLQVQSGIAKMMEETNISCIDITSSGVIEFFVEDVQQEGDNLIMTLFESLVDSGYVFEPYNSAGSAAGACIDSNNGRLTLTPVVGEANYTRDPLFDFDVVDATFAENYAFFELRGIDWNASTAEARASLTSESTDDELFDALVAVLDPLDDSHVFLFSNTSKFGSKPHQVVEMLTEEYEQHDEIEDYETYEMTQLFRWLDQIMGGYMDEPLQSDQEGIFFWGRFKDDDNATNVGYMNLLGFYPLDVDAFSEQLDTAFEELADTNAIVFDVRFNGGGSDTVGLLVASHFVSDEPVFAFSKRAVDGDGFTESLDVYIEPGDAAYRYDGDVVLIVSGSTVSAAEVFALSMKQLPQVTTLGRNTAGAFSDMLNRILPNGWKFSLSNEVYSDPDGTIYEKTGITPDILPAAELLPLSEREAGVDSWLELALETAKSPFADEPMSGSNQIFKVVNLSSIVGISLMFRLALFVV